MEYVQGKTLDRLIPGYGMRLNEALKVSVQTAEALATAHAVGIVHRDLKPANAPAFPSRRRQKDGDKGRGVSPSIVAKLRGGCACQAFGSLVGRTVLWRLSVKGRY